MRSHVIAQSADIAHGCNASSSHLCIEWRLQKLHLDVEMSLSSTVGRQREKLLTDHLPEAAHQHIVWWALGYDMVALR